MLVHHHERCRIYQRNLACDVGRNPAGKMDPGFAGIYGTIREISHKMSVSSVACSISLTCAQSLPRARWLASLAQCGASSAPSHCHKSSKSAAARGPKAQPWSIRPHRDDGPVAPAPPTTAPAFFITGAFGCAFGGYLRRARACRRRVSAEVPAGRRCQGKIKRRYRASAKGPLLICK